MHIESTHSNPSAQQTHTHILFPPYTHRDTNTCKQAYIHHHTRIRHILLHTDVHMHLCTYRAHALSQINSHHADFRTTSHYLSQSPSLPPNLSNYFLHSFSASRLSFSVLFSLSPQFYFSQFNSSTSI